MAQKVLICVHNEYVAGISQYGEIHSIKELIVDQQFNSFCTDTIVVVYLCIKHNNTNWKCY